MLDNRLPNVTELLLARFAYEEPRVAESIVDVGASLTSRTVVHVKDEVQTMELIIHSQLVLRKLNIYPSGLSQLPRFVPIYIASCHQG